MTPDEIAAIKKRADRATTIGVLPAEHCSVVYRLIAALAERDAEIARLNEKIDGPEGWKALYRKADERADTMSDRAAEAEAALAKTREMNDVIGKWLSAALDDPQVCAEMKADINAWFAAHN